MFWLSAISKYLLVQQLDCWSACSANSQCSGSVPYPNTSWSDSWSADLLAQQICDFSAQYHTRNNNWSAGLLTQQICDFLAQCYTRSNSWSADLLAQQIRNSSAQYHTRTPLEQQLECWCTCPADSRFSSSVLYPEQQLECWFTYSANLQFSSSVLYPERQLECWFACSADSQFLSLVSYSYISWTTARVLMCLSSRFAIF